MDDRLYSTGEFAKLCGVKKQTLFHYDQIGLLEPAVRDEKGFRRYTHEQYGDYLMIACLKEAGMALKDIAAYLSTDSDEERAATLEACLEQLDAKIEYLKRVRQILANTFAQKPQEKGAGTELDRDTTLAYRSARRFYASPRLDILDDRQLVEAVAAIVQEVEPQAVCLPSERVEAGDLDIQSHLLVGCEQVEGTDLAQRLGLAAFSLPEGRYAEIELYPDDDPVLVYERLRTDISLMHCHPGPHFFELLPHASGEAATPSPTIVTTEILLDDDAPGEEEGEGADAPGAGTSEG